MARDAIARQYDVDKNKVILTCEPGKENYRPGTIRFEAKKGKSIDLDKVRESIAATRLSGGTNMGMDYLELTVTGTVGLRDKDLVLKVSGTAELFVLEVDPDAKGAMEKLRGAVARGEAVSTVVGRVRGWKGRFPDVLAALAKASPEARHVLMVREFEVAKK
jgi:hypothetical protein